MPSVGISAAYRGDAARTDDPAVPSYRYYFLDAANNVAATDLIECGTDDQAKARANIMLIASDYPGIEVWDRSRVVYRVLKTEPPPDRAP